MALSGFTNDPNELMRLILERSECSLEKEGDKLGVFGESYLSSSLTGSVCLDDNITNASQLLDVICENVDNNFVDDFKYELGLGSECEWHEVVEAFEECFQSGELDKDDPNIVEEYEAMKLLVMNGTELNAAVDLNKVYDLQEAYWQAVHENAMEANKALRDRDDRA